MKKILAICLLLCSCSSNQDRQIVHNDRNIVHNVDIRHVDLDTLKQRVLKVHGFMNSDSLKLKGLTLDDCKYIYGSNCLPLWSPFIIKDSLGQPEGTSLDLKKYPVEVVAYKWSRNDSMDIGIYFVKERDTFVVIDAIQTKKEVFFLE